jgi:formate/nitrite transporter FocA (FNT family)
MNDNVTENENNENDEYPINRIILSGILAGIFLSIFSYIYIYIENKYVGSIIYSGGILTVLILDLELCIWRFYYKNIDILYLLLIIILNLIGVTLVSLFINYLNKDTSKINQYVSLELNKSYPNLFFDSIICGIIIGLGIILFQLTNNIILLIIFISSYLLLGTNHFISNSFYILTTIKIFGNEECLKFLIINLLGNFIGCKIMSYIFIYD